ncbi:WXG100 family type VII secretion target [Streptomyces sp. NPDC002143]
MAALQQSQVRDTQNGINALEQAFTSVQTRRQDLENTKANLATSHQGSDGKAYQDLLALWDEQAEVISRNLRDMINTLNETLRQQGIAQGSANDSVNQAYNQSQSVFDALSG